MGRSLASVWIRIALTSASWLLAVSFVQAEAGADITRGVRKSEERIELRMREGSDPSTSGPAEPATPARRHEESIEPWELVSV